MKIKAPKHKTPTRPKFKLPTRLYETPIKPKFKLPTRPIPPYEIQEEHQENMELEFLGRFVPFPMKSYEVVVDALEKAGLFWENEETHINVFRQVEEEED